MPARDTIQEATLHRDLGNLHLAAFNHPILVVNIAVTGPEYAVVTFEFMRTYKKGASLDKTPPEKHDYVLQITDPATDTEQGWTHRKDLLHSKHPEPFAELKTYIDLNDIYEI